MNALIFSINRKTQNKNKLPLRLNGT